MAQVYFDEILTRETELHARCPKCRKTVTVRRGTLKEFERYWQAAPPALCACGYQSIYINKAKRIGKFRDAVGKIVLTILLVGGAIAAIMPSPDEMRRREAADAQREIDRRHQIEAAVRNHEVLIGMKSRDVLRAWGKPEDQNRTITADQVTEQWVYGRRYVYLTNGVVTAIQD